MGVGRSYLTPHLVLLPDEFFLTVVVVTALHHKARIRLSVHVGEKQRALIGVEENLAIAQVSVGGPVLCDEVAAGRIGVVKL